MSFHKLLFLQIWAPNRSSRPAPILTPYLHIGVFPHLLFKLSSLRIKTKKRKKSLEHLDLYVLSSYLEPRQENISTPAMLDHERDDSRVQQDDITRLEHVNTVSTTVSQHMDGSSVEDVLPKPSNDPNDPLVSTSPGVQSRLMLLIFTR